MKQEIKQSLQPERGEDGPNKLVEGEQRRCYPAAHKWAGEQESTALVTSCYHHFKLFDCLVPKPDEILNSCSMGWAGPFKGLVLV